MINYRSSATREKTRDLYYIPVSTTFMANMSEYTLYLGAAFLLGASIMTTQFLFNDSTSDSLHTQTDIAQQHYQYPSGLSVQPVQD